MTRSVPNCSMLLSLTLGLARGVQTLTGKRLIDKHRLIEPPEGELTFPPDTVTHKIWKFLKRAGFLKRVGITTLLRTSTQMRIQTAVAQREIISSQ